MPDSDSLDVEIEIDLGLEAETPAPEEQKASAEPTPDKADESAEEPAAQDESETDDIAAALAGAIAELESEEEPAPEEAVAAPEEASPEEAEAAPEEAEAAPEEAEAAPEEAEAAPEEAEAAPALPEINVTDASSLDFRRVGISAWKVRVKIGLVYDFSDIKTLRKYITDGRVTNEDVISHDGKEWTVLGDIPDLDAHFIDVYRHALVDHPEALREINTAPIGESDELSEEAVELTNSILEQINQEVEASPAPAVGPEFSDPFQALKSAQKQRGKQRTRMSKARKAHATESERQQRLGLIFLVILLAVLFIINPFSSSPDAEIADVVDPNTTISTSDEIPTGPSDLEKEMQAQIAAKLEEQKTALRAEEAENSEPQLRAVAPPEARALLEGGAEINLEGGPTPRAVSPSRRAKKAYRNGDYQAAVDAYKEALESRNSPKLHLGYGKALYRVGSWSPAERELKKAERAGAADEEAYRFLIDLLRRRGDDAGANAYKQKLQRYRNR